MSGPALDPELLKAFLAVADQLSFTRAARSLNRTQSAVSSQIKRLETQLGTELFKRSTTNVALSAAGEGLVGYARRILMLGDEAVQRLKQHRMEGRVRLGVMDDYGALILPPILKSFSNLYPAIELQMETGLTSGMVRRLGRAYDIVIAMHEAGEQTGEFLRREQAVWAGPASINPKDLDPLRSRLSDRMSVPKVGLGCPRSCRARLAACFRQSQPRRGGGDRQSGLGHHGREIGDAASIARAVRA
jgi:DNA-binding transcriptional LysR family regulator